MTSVEKPRTPSSRTRQRRSEVVIPHQPTLLQKAGAWIVFLGLHLLMRTLRYRWNDPGRVFEQNSASPVIFAIWHNRLALCMEAYRKYDPAHERTGMAALVSASKDGGFLSGILNRFGVQAVRGSSSRRGAQALLELTSWAERGYDLALTPDGPRGPCYTVQEGVLILAQLTGLPVIPVSYTLQWKIRLNSWDRFQIPLPFSKCEMNVGSPIYVPKDIADSQREELRRQLESSLKSLTRD